MYENLDVPDWARTLRHLYRNVRLRRHFQTPGLRTWQRRIAIEKRRLIESGISPLYIHLVSRYLLDLKNPYPSPAKKRLDSYQRLLKLGKEPANGL